ncbi:MAG: hypothetical protein H6679_03815 [Epsilonproteobacteria bacterium]|nr:hypothetical protein [Campylobacterota bacterium]
MLFYGIIYFLLLSWVPSISAASISAKTSISYNTSQVSFSAGDDVTGFVYFKEGFKCPPSGGSMTMSLAGIPVNGEIDLNGGVLELNDDLFLSSSSKITGSGHILGNGHSVYLGNDLIITGSITFEGATPQGIVINGDGNTLELRNEGLLRFQASNLTATLRNITIKNANLTFAGAAPGSFRVIAAEMTYDNVKIIMGRLTGFPKGLELGGFRNTVIRKLTIAGSGLTFGNDSTRVHVTKNSVLDIDQDITFRLSTVGAPFTVPTFEDRSSVLRMNNTTAFIQGFFGPVELKRGTLLIEGAWNTFHFSGSGSSPNITIGGGPDPADDMDIVIRNGALWRMTRNIFSAAPRFTYNNTT